jgi:prevent-host-death family protein
MDLIAESTTVGTLEAKNNLSQLIDRVATGETITITRHGVPVAKLVPAGTVDVEAARKAVEEWERIRVGVRLGDDLTIRQLIDEGRRR